MCTARHAWFAADRELAVARLPRENSDGNSAVIDGKARLCPGVQVHVRRGGKRRGRESRAASPQERCTIIMALGITHGTAHGHAHQFAQRERGDGERERERAVDGGASLGETHLIIARFRHLAPALNNALPLTHSLLPPLSIRPLCASMGRRDGEVHGAFDPAAGIISRCVRRVASAPCPPPYGAASHRPPPRENEHSVSGRERRTIPGCGQNDRRGIAAD